METNIHSSFIPQEAAAPMRTRSGGGMFDLFGLIAIVFFVASATLAVGVFLYVQFLNTQVTSMVKQLEVARDQFDPKLIEELTLLDDRMRAADAILSTHTAPSALFRLLENLTLKSVAYSSLDFDAAPDGISINMDGVAQSVNAIALQADLLARSGTITDPVFSNINRRLGGVQFNFEAKVNQSAIRYRDIVNGISQQAQPAQQEPAPAEQTPPSPFGSPTPAPAPVRQ